MELKITEPNIKVIGGGKDELLRRIDYLLNMQGEGEVEFNNGVEMDLNDYLKLTCPKCAKVFQYQRLEVPAGNVVCDCGQKIIEYD